MLQNLKGRHCLHSFSGSCDYFCRIRGFLGTSFGGKEQQQKEGMTQKSGLFKGQKKKDSAANRHGKEIHIRKGTSRSRAWGCSGIYKSCPVRLCCSYTSDLGKLCVAFASRLKRFIRIILQLTMTCGCELVDLHRAPAMLCEFLVHAWRKFGGLNQEHSI